MFSPEAVPALTTETRGQNSWVNFGEHMRNPEGNVPKKGEPGFVPATERPYAEQKTGLLPEQFHAAAPGTNWAHDVAARLPEESAGGINPQNPEAPSKRYGFEILPEHRQQLDKAPTAQDFQKYAQDHAEHIGMHPDMRLGWDTGGTKPELNIGAATNDLATAKKIAGKLDQRALWDNVKKEEVPVGGEGKKTEFPEYPVAQRIADLAKAEPLPEEATGGRAESIGKSVRAFTKSNESYKILDSAHGGEGAGDDWAHGGCWMLADAVQKKFGGNVVSIEDGGTVQHIATKIGDKYIDAYGAHTAEQLLDRLKSEDGLKNPRITPLEPSKVPADIPRPDKDSEIASSIGAVAETRASYKPKIEAAQALGPDGGTQEQGDYVKDYKAGNYVGALQAGIANTEE
jgi:hypothetical protein